MPANDVIRMAIFKHSQTAADSVIRRLVDASAHLRRHDAYAAFDAMEDLNRDIAKVRCLMLIILEMEPKKERYV